jgi:hypothetical protein
MANSTSILATISTQGLAGNIIIANSTSVLAGIIDVGIVGKGITLLAGYIVNGNAGNITIACR